MKAQGDGTEWPLWVRTQPEIQNMFNIMAPVDGDGEGESTAKAWGIDPCILIRWFHILANGFGVAPKPVWGARYSTFGPITCPPKLRLMVVGFSGSVLLRTEDEQPEEENAERLKLLRAKTLEWGNVEVGHCVSRS